MRLVWPTLISNNKLNKAEARRLISLIRQKGGEPQNLKPPCRGEHNCMILCKFKPPLLRHFIQYLILIWLFIQYFTGIYWPNDLSMKYCTIEPAPPISTRLVQYEILLSRIIFEELLIKRQRQAIGLQALAEVPAQGKVQGVADSGKIPVRPSGWTWTKRLDLDQPRCPLQLLPG